MTPEEIVAYAKRRFVGDLGLSDEQFYGVMGSTMGESGRNLNYRAHNPNDPDGGAYGLFQHVGPRWRGLKAYADESGRDVYDPRTQIDYVVDVELQGDESKALDAVRASDDRYAANEAWTNLFERPAKAYRFQDKRNANSDYVANMDGKGLPDPSTISYSGSGEGDSPDHPSSILAKLGDGILGLGSTEKLSLDGPSTPFQKLAVMAGSAVDPELGGRFMLDLFGGGGREGADLTLTEGLAMTAGGLLGGVPGAMAAAGLHEVISGLFKPEGAERKKEAEKAATPLETVEEVKAEEYIPSDDGFGSLTGGTETIVDPEHKGRKGILGGSMGGQSASTGIANPLAPLDQLLRGLFGG